MPNFNFECNNKKCAHQFDEIFLTFKDYEEQGPPKCPKCGKDSTRIYWMINGESMNIRYKGLPMGDGPSAGITSLSSRYPKGR
jgi:hypothetical protein